MYAYNLLHGVLKLELQVAYTVCWWLHSQSNPSVAHLLKTKWQLWIRARGSQLYGCHLLGWSSLYSWPCCDSVSSRNYLAAIFYTTLCMAVCTDIYDNMASSFLFTPEPLVFVRLVLLSASTLIYNIQSISSYCIHTCVQQILPSPSLFCEQEFLSELGIVHRDLACRNVLVGKNKVLKISDFGMARENDIYVNTTDGKLPLRWMAIESIVDRVFTTKSDVWVVKY